MDSFNGGAIQLRKLWAKKKLVHFVNSLWNKFAKEISTEEINELIWNVRIDNLKASLPKWLVVMLHAWIFVYQPLLKEIQSIKAIDENQVTISEKWSISTLNDDNTIQHNSRQSTAFVDKWKIRMKIYQMEAIANCFIAQRFISSLLFGIAFYQKRLFTKNTLHFHEK